jgi:predicted ABC-type sugar transport system permease subunit
MSRGAVIALGAVIGFMLGLVVSLATDVPLAPEVGLLLGALGGWLMSRDGP